MNNTIKFLVEEDDIGKRVDIFLSNNIKFLTRSNLKKLIEQKQLKINDSTIISPATKLKKEDKVFINVISKKNDYVNPKNIKLDIVYEDDDLLVVNKPKGMVVHPGAGNKEETLVNALLFKYKDNLSNINGKLRPGIVHRIDKDTSGLLVVAKNNLSHSNLGKQFSTHSIRRTYLCLVWGVIRPLNGKIITFITRDKRNRQLMTVSELRGKKAITNYKTIKVFNVKDIPKISLIECKLETGRTHQIRVHMKYKGSSLIGDQHYGKKKYKFKKVNLEFQKLLFNFKGQALHAKTLEFFHPVSNKSMSFKSNLPLEFKKMLNFLRKLSS